MKLVSRDERRGPVHSIAMTLHHVTRYTSLVTRQYAHSTHLPTDH